MTPCYAYLRVSGKSQLDGDGFERQLTNCTAFAAANSLTIARIYKEEGVSGTKGASDRLAWVRMIADALESGTTTIILERLDRLARDLMVQEHILADIKSRGLTLISCAEPDLCADDPSRKLVRQIVGAVAEYDRAMIVLKLKGARQRMKVRTGRCEGRKPYGATEWERAIIADARAIRSSGGSLMDAATHLNAHGYTTRYGHLWTVSMVSRILRRISA
jgi:DNA invertase Pin-like site-specific DNA recombinase